MSSDAVLSRSCRALLLVACAVAACGCGKVLGADFEGAKGKAGKPCGIDGTGVTNDSGACQGPSMQLAAMFHHTCALMHDQTVWCWGENKFGEVGDTTNEFRANPVKVGGLPPVISIGAGEGHTCAITVDHEVYCWGTNVAGQLGFPLVPVTDPIEAFGPTRVEPLVGVQVETVTAGRGHTCARAGDEVYCWGANNEKQCGNLPDLSVSPQKVPNLSRVTEVQSIKYHNCALRGEEPRMVCWGTNERSQLGPAAGELASSADPVPITLPGSIGVGAFGLSFDSTYAVGGDGLVYSWGYNKRGQLGTGSQELVVVEPAPVVYPDPKEDNLLNDVVHVYRSDGSHQCAEVLTPDSHGGAKFVCWGGDDAGELGRGVLPTAGENFFIAQPAVAIPNSAIGLVHGEDHGCAIMPDHDYEIWCWGRGGFVGDGRVPETPGTEIKPPQLDARPVQWLR